MHLLLALLRDSPLLVAVALSVLVWVAWDQLPLIAWSPAQWWSRRREISQLRASLAANPHDATAHAELGRLLTISGAHAQAISELEAALERMPEAPEPRLHLGLARLGLGQWEQGRKDIDAALHARPSLHYGDPHLALGSYQLAQGDAAEALPHLMRFTAINATSSEGFFKCGLAHAALGDNRAARNAWSEALAASHFRKANRVWALRAWLARLRLR